jgi:alkyl hydroperoxide reductase subunit AhpF
MSVRDNGFVRFQFGSWRETAAALESGSTKWSQVQFVWFRQMAEDIRDTVILGTGCAGLTAAIYTARANLKPLVLEGHEPGGQLSITTMVENFPGWPDGIQGPELIENMRKQASRFGAEFRLGHLATADLTKHPFALNLGRETVHARTLIIASGADWAWSELVRDLRWIFLLGEGDRRGWRRRFGDGGSAVFDSVCDESDADSSA